MNDAKLLLEGSKGRIGLVILVKISPLKPLEMTIQNGIVEVWTLESRPDSRVTQGKDRIGWYDSWYTPFPFQRLTLVLDTLSTKEDSVITKISLSWEEVLCEGTSPAPIHSRMSVP